MMDTQPQPPLAALLGDIRDAVTAELHVRLRALGFAEIRPAHGCVFSTIGEQGSRLTDLAQRAGLTKQSVGEAVLDLERLGYVERVPDPDDRRAKIITLTPHGAEVLAAARAIFADIERRFAEEIGEERFAEFRETAERLSALTRGSTAAAPSVTSTLGEPTPAPLGG
jgi:DNA-binding MarR family transcriptional regulator